MSNNYKIKKTDNTLFNFIIKIKSNIFFLISLFLLIVFLVLFYPMFHYWYLNDYNFFDMKIFKVNLTLTTFIIPFFFGSLIMGFLSYLDELFG